MRGFDEFHSHKNPDISDAPMPKAPDQNWPGKTDAQDKPQIPRVPERTMNDPEVPYRPDGKPEVLDNPFFPNRTPDLQAPDSSERPERREPDDLENKMPQRGEPIEKGIPVIEMRDGQFRDTETGRFYDSFGDWVTERKALADRYEGTAKYYQNRADKEWASYRELRENGADGQEPYAKAREYDSKAQEFRNKAEGVRKTLPHYAVSAPRETNGSKTEGDGGQDVREPGKPIQNKVDGLNREREVAQELKEKYPPEEGYEIIPEAYLRDENGNIVRDPETGEARRIDFVVVKDGKVVDSVEVTSKTADKTEQSAKENRIREAGGNYVRDSAGNLVEFPSDVKTRIERRD